MAVLVFPKVKVKKTLIKTVYGKYTEFDGSWFDHYQQGYNAAIDECIRRIKIWAAYNVKGCRLEYFDDAVIRQWLIRKIPLKKREIKNP